MNQPKRRISNFEYFQNILGANWKKAYMFFMKAEVEENMICSSYDSEGFCIFEKTDKENVWEFTGTAK